jgi:hypothetical protein
MLRFACPACKATLQIPEAMAGMLRTFAAKADKLVAKHDRLVAALMLKLGVDRVD